MPKKILLADDSITIQKVVELTFSDGDYEVTAVNNGAKAVQKLAEMRPDIILSDIIMPEKNGYEVCEYVKSHPEYRSIPVVLLTGTFEPFDPDRAEKAGCDAVVTKPFESQSLIHKVEELIAQAQSASAAAPPAPEPAPEPAASPWLDDTPAAAPEPRAPISPFSTATEAVPALSLPYTHDNDIFGAAPSTAGSADMPFETPADQSQDSPFGAPPPAEEFSGETRAFPRMSFEEMQALATGGSAPSAPEPVPTVPPPPPAPEPVSPWDEPADASPFAAEPAGSSPFDSGAEFGGETRSFTKMDFEELNRMAPPPPPLPEAEPEPDSPFGAPPPAEEFSGETRAFPRMSFEELQQMAQTPAAPEPPIETTPEPSPWDEPAEPAAFSGETRAFPKMSFEEMQQMAQTPSAPAWAPEEEAPAETPFASTSAPEPVLEELPVPETQPAWSTEPEPEPVWSKPEAVPAWTEPESEPAPAWTAPEPEPEPVWAAPEEPEPQPEPQAEPEPEPVAAASSALAAPSEPSIPISRELTDDQVDRIARRVVELMSDQVVRNIAWEVIPDLAEMVVKERIRQLEAEA
jgi:CheY-like chemotaxis protein